MDWIGLDWIGLDRTNFSDILFDKKDKACITHEYIWAFLYLIINHMFSDTTLTEPGGMVELMSTTTSIYKTIVITGTGSRNGGLVPVDSIGP